MNGLIRQAQKLDREKASLLSDLGSWSGDHLSRKPSITSWSALEVLDHLTKVEKEMLARWREQLPDGQPVGISHRWRAWIVRCVMRSPVRVAVPQGAEAVLPDQGLTLRRIAEQWQETRDEMLQVLQSLSEVQLAQGFVRHPVSGWMTPGMTLAFLRVHLGHHRYQIERLKRFNFQ